MQPQYKESSTYLTKYRVCLNTALSSVRGWVLQALEQCVQQAKKADGTTPATGIRLILSTHILSRLLFHYKSYLLAQAKVTHLLYCTVNSGCMPIRWNSLWPTSNNVMKKDPRRFRICYFPERGEQTFWSIFFFLLLKRYEQLLSDCHAAYFNQRLSLLRPSVVASLTDLSTTYVRDHCSLSRCSCTFLLRICHDEWQLYHQFFGLQSPLLEWVAVSLFANWSVNPRFSFFFSPFLP